MAWLRFSRGDKEGKVNESLSCSIWGDITLSDDVGYVLLIIIIYPANYLIFHYNHTFTYI